MSVTKLTKEIYDQKLNGDQLFVIKFYADWCGPCKMLKVEYDKIADAYAKEVFFSELNTDDCNENDQTDTIVEKYKVFSIPHVVFIKKGEIVDSFVGYKPYDELEKIVKKHI